MGVGQGAFFCDSADTYSTRRRVPELLVFPTFVSVNRGVRTHPSCNPDLEER